MFLSDDESVKCIECQVVFLLEISAVNFPIHEYLQPQTFLRLFFFTPLLPCWGMVVRVGNVVKMKLEYQQRMAEFASQIVGRVGIGLSFQVPIYAYVINNERDQRIIRNDHTPLWVFRTL